MSDNYFDFFFHEIGTITGSMKRSLQHILEAFPDNSEKIDKPRIKSHAGKLTGSVELIETYIKFVTLMNNPDFYRYTRPRNIDLRGTFRKVGRIMKLKYNQQKKKLFTDELSDVSHVPLIEIFDVVPYIVLDNAFKYSSNAEEIYVSLNLTREGKFDIKIRSCGPYVYEDELERLTEYQYRGENALDADVNGYGLGLYFLKEICEICEVKLKLETKKLDFKLNGVENGEFCVHLSNLTATE